MPQKDHLGTREEYDKGRSRDLKRIVANNYQSSPPLLTGNLSGIGFNTKTSKEIKNVAFPILFTIDDESGNISNTVNIDLSLEDSHYHIVQLSDNGGTIANINVNFINLPKNKLVSFFLDFIKDPLNVSTPTVTFSPTLQGLPSGFPTVDDRYLLHIIAKDSPAETRYEVVPGFGSGGTSVPVGTTENDHLEWNDTTLMWERKQILEFGVGAGLHAETGFLNFLNNTVGLAWRNLADTGDLQIKADSVDAFDFTNSANGPVTIKIRAQHATQADQNLLLYQFAGTSGGSFLSAPTIMQFQIGATDVFSYDANGVDLAVGLYMGGNIINDFAALVGFTTTNVIDDTVSGWDYKVALGHEHDFFVDTSSKFTIGSLLTMKADLDANHNLISNAFRIDFSETGGAGDPNKNVIYNDNINDKFNIQARSTNTLQILHGDSIITDVVASFTQSLIDFTYQTLPYTEVDLGDVHVFGIHQTDGEATFIDQLNIKESAVPGTGTALFAKLYAKADGGVTKLFYKYSDGTEVGPLGAGGSSNSISQGNSNITVTDPGTGAINFTIDAVNIISMLSTVIGFNVSLSMGASIDMNSQNITEAHQIEFENTGTTSATNPRISANTTDMLFSMPLDTDAFNFYADGTLIFEVLTDGGATPIGSIRIPNVFTLESDGTMQWNVVGSAHRINITGSELQLLTENTADDITFWTGTSRVNETLSVQDGITSWKTINTDVNPYTLQIIQNHDTPATNRTIGTLQGLAENSISIDTVYGQVEFSTAGSVTSGSENGRVSIDVMSNGGVGAAVRAEGSAAGIQLGFYGTSPVQQSPAYTVTNPTTDRALNVTGDTLAQVAAVLGTVIADLKLLGLLG